MEVKRLREAAHMTQEALAVAMGIDRTTVSCWERNVSMPRADQLPKLADLLGCTIDALFDREAAKDTA